MLGRRVVAEGHGAVGGDEARRVLAVLHAEGNPLERSRIPTLPALLGLPGLADEVIAVAECHDCTELSVERLDAIERGFHQLDGRQLLAGHPVEQLGERALEKVGQRVASSSGRASLSAARTPFSEPECRTIRLGPDGSERPRKGRFGADFALNLRPKCL